MCLERYTQHQVCGHRVPDSYQYSECEFPLAVGHEQVLTKTLVSGSCGCGERPDPEIVQSLPNQEPLQPQQQQGSTPRSGPGTNNQNILQILADRLEQEMQRQQQEGEANDWTWVYSSADQEQQQQQGGCIPSGFSGHFVKHLARHAAERQRRHQEDNSPRPDSASGGWTCVQDDPAMRRRQRQRLMGGSLRLGVAPNDWMFEPSSANEEQMPQPGRSGSSRTG